MDRRRQQNSRVRERRLRAQYRRNIKIAIVVALVVGLAAGYFVGARLTARKAGAPVAAPAPTPDAQTPAPTAEITAEPTAEITTEPTAEPTAAPTATPLPTVTPTPLPTATPEPEEIIVPFGQTQTISAQINNDGTARKTNDTQTYETLNFSLRVLRYLTPEYYQDTYSTRYRMQGNEAGVEFELTLNDYMGSQTIVPQELFTIGLETANGIVEQGYQLTNAEIQGEKVIITTNIPTLTYKRFVYSDSVGDMKYLSVTAVVDGEAQKYLFELGEPVRPTPEPTAEPTPAPTYAPLEVSSRGDDVKALQQKLIDLGYLTGSADGAFGAMTEQAVKDAQAAFGMEQTGVADDAFQKRLFSEN